MVYFTITAITWSSGYKFKEHNHQGYNGRKNSIKRRKPAQSKRNACGSR